MTNRIPKSYNVTNSWQAANYLSHNYLNTGTRKYQRLSKHYYSLYHSAVCWAFKNWPTFKGGATAIYAICGVLPLPLSQSQRWG